MVDPIIDLELKQRRLRLLHYCQDYMAIANGPTNLNTAKAYQTGNMGGRLVTRNDSADTSTERSEQNHAISPKKDRLLSDVVNTIKQNNPLFPFSKGS